MTHHLGYPIARPQMVPFQGFGTIVPAHDFGHGTLLTLLSLG